MSGLQKSAQTRRPRLSSPYEVMEALRISVKREKGRNFWLANEHELPGIYAEFCREVRNRLRELHPDTGGDGHAFGEFRAASNRIRKVFEKKGFGRDLALERALRAQTQFEERVSARKKDPYFREYDEDSEIDLSAWKMGVYDRLVDFSEPIVKPRRLRAPRIQLALGRLLKLAMRLGLQ